jgi:hypothetical protein
MVKPDLSPLRQRLQALQAEMARLLPVFLGRAPLLPAYLSYRPRTCGNPGCKCARGELHPAWIVQFSASGRRQCRSVPKARFTALAGPAEAYRRFRAARARWNRLVREAQTVLEAIERCRTRDPQEAVEKP